ncbi:MAG: ATP-binding protein [Ignavibacteriaceae bacterium]|nr:ATP-binding protein [Ignavibacteriaceae bacterium]
MFQKFKLFLSSTRFKTTIWYSTLFLVLEILLGIFIYLSLYDTLMDNLDIALKTQAKGILRLVMEKHMDIDHFVPDSIYTDPEDLVWDVIYNEVAFNLRNNYIQINFKRRIVFKSANLNDDTLSFKNKPGTSAGLYYITDTTLSQKPIRCVQLEANNYKILVAFPIAHIAQTLNSLAHIFIILAPIFFLISILGGALISAKSLSRIDAIIKKTEEITASNLDEKISGERYSDEYGRLVKKMNEMISRIKTSIDYMNQFSISAAHELKTPLTILRGETEIALKSPKLPEEYVEVLRSNYEETLRLTKIIDNLFFISKIDHSLIDIKKEKINLDEYLKNTVNSFKILGAEKNISLVADSGTNSSIEIDKELMTQALSNLIDNAIKYGEENNVVTVKGEICDSNKIKISVINKGEGIPQESIPKIFDRFYSVESSRNRKTGGVGLGLSVVKAIVTWHGAEIYAKSVPNETTEFYILLPKAV